MIIDIRSISAFQQGHIPGARNIPFVELLQNPQAYLEKTKEYQIYCEYGNKSKMLVQELRKQGYNCVNIDGGYHNYLFKK